MANDNFSQQALAGDPTFRQRVKASLARIAWQILTEDPATPSHPQRAIYARNFLAMPDSTVANLVGWFVFRTNVMGFPTAVGFDGRGGTVVTTGATDADLDSQLATDWNALAGV